MALGNGRKESEKNVGIKLALNSHDDDQELAVRRKLRTLGLDPNRLDKERRVRRSARDARLASFSPLDRVISWTLLSRRGRPCTIQANTASNYAASSLLHDLSQYPQDALPSLGWDLGYHNRSDSEASQRWTSSLTAAVLALHLHSLVPARAPLLARCLCIAAATLAQHSRCETELDAAENARWLVLLADAMVSHHQWILEPPWKRAHAIATLLQSKVNSARAAGTRDMNVATQHCIEEAEGSSLDKLSAESARLVMDCLICEGDKVLVRLALDGFESLFSRRGLSRRKIDLIQAAAPPAPDDEMKSIDTTTTTRRVAVHWPTRARVERNEWIVRGAAAWWRIWSWLPPRVQLGTPHLIWDTSRDGMSWPTLMRSAPNAPVIVVASTKTNSGQLVGVFLSNMHSKGRQRHADGDAFVWRQNIGQCEAPEIPIRVTSPTSTLWYALRNDGLSLVEDNGRVLWMLDSNLETLAAIGTSAESNAQTVHSVLVKVVQIVVIQEREFAVEELE